MKKTPSYRLHKASGQAVVTLDGRDHYLGPHGTPDSRAEYDRLISAWLANGRRLAVRDEELTVVEMLARYWEHAQVYYADSPKSLWNIKYAIRPVRRLFGPTRAADFGPLSLDAVRQSMITNERLSRKTINRRIGYVRTIFRWAASRELVPPSVPHGLDTLGGLKRGRSTAREHDPIRPVPRSLVDAIEPHVSRQVWALVELQWWTGARSGELVIMRGQDLDTMGKVWEYRPERHKTKYRGHERVIFLGPQAQDAVTPFLRFNPAEYLFSPADAEAERKAAMRAARKTKVQPSQRCRKKRKLRKQPGERFTVDSYARAIRRGCELAKIVPHWTPHQLRHAAGTRIRKDYGIEAARVVLGHRSAVVTELYAEVDYAKARSIISQVG